MLFTTFLTILALGSLVFLGALLIKPKRDAKPTRIPAGLALVGTLAALLTIVGLVLV
jgi:hypothetical protein